MRFNHIHYYRTSRIFILRHYLSPVHRRFDRRKIVKKNSQKNCMNIASASHTAPSTPTAVYTGETDFRYLLHNSVGPVGFEPTTKKL